MPLNHYVTLGRSGLRVSPFCLGAAVRIARAEVAAELGGEDDPVALFAIVREVVADAARRRKPRR